MCFETECQLCKENFFYCSSTLCPRIVAVYARKVDLVLLSASCRPRSDSLFVSLDVISKGFFLARIISIDELTRFLVDTSINSGPVVFSGLCDDKSVSAISYTVLGLFPSGPIFTCSTEQYVKRLI